MAELEKAWYVKYRPKTLDEYSGPEIKQIISKRFTKRENFPHVIMISGPRGTGKTTFARMISKFYLCENPNPDGTPCEHCQTCEEINETLISGESGVEAPGVTEIDATITNGKDALQEALEDAVVPPMYTEFKVLIMDEVHMVSAAAQNSMLKTIEDIPPHLVVIFATTNPEKVLQTIKSRCQLMLEAKKQTVQNMVNRLRQICEMEHCPEVSNEALEIIAKKGDRVPRECITLLENVAMMYDKHITMDNVREYLGNDGSMDCINFFEAANTDLTSIMNFIYDLRNKDVKISKFIGDLMNFTLDAMYVKHGVGRDEYTTEYVKNIEKIFKMYSTQDFDMLLQCLDTANRAVSEDNDKKNELTLTVLAMRISKIELLANGLDREQESAIAENKISMVEHSKLIEEKRKAAKEQMTMAITPEIINDEYEDVKVVESTAGLNLPSISEDEITRMHEQKKEVIEKDINTGDSDIDKFFNS